MGNVETQSTLAGQGCDNPECDNPECRNAPRLYFHGCHGSNFEAMYEKATGCLTLICRKCKKSVVRFLLAAGVH